VETAKGKTREEIINRLADRIDSFEKYTQPHSRFIAVLSLHLARRFGLATPDIEAIAEAAMLHDVGLYAMSPSYHSLSRPLSFEARLDLWRHSVIGEQQMAKRDATRHSQLLVRWHHEWWNGSGYPDMLAFEDIPIGARILRAVELLAALLSDRPYRAALDEEHALEALTASAGVECDPYVVKALRALLDELRAEIHQPAVAQIPEDAINVEPTDSPTPEPPVAALESVGAELPTPIAKNDSPAAFDESPYAHPVSEPAVHGSEAADASRKLSADLWAVTLEPSEPREFETQKPTHVITPPNETAAPEPPATYQIQPPIHPIERLLKTAQSKEIAENDSPRWLGWSGSRYNKKALVGFEASVLRQIEFRSIAIPFWSDARLDWYLKAWGKLIFANDPRVWASTVARATVEASESLGEEAIVRILEDVYVPGVKLSNPGLRQWFGESDAWWMDNLRRNIERIDDQLMRAQALTLGLHTGDYTLSFDDETRELRRPLTTVFWRLAGRAFTGPIGQPHNRSSHQPAEDFIKHARADLLYLSLPASHSDRGGSEARSEWRESWVSGASGGDMEQSTLPKPPQSKQSYLATIDRLLRPASSFRTWAVEYQEPGLATAQDIIDLIKEYRPVRATYSKDVTEVAGGLRSYIMIGERTSAR